MREELKEKDASVDAGSSTQSVESRVAISGALVQIPVLKAVFLRSLGGVSVPGERRIKMRELEIEILAASEVRRTLTNGRDIRGDVDFQNDVNALLARVEHLQMPWRSLSDLSPAPLASAIMADTTPLPVARPAKPALAGLRRLPPLVVASRPQSSARR